MNFRSVIGLPRGVFRELGNGARKLWAGSKGVSSGRRERVRRRLVPALRSGVWSDFNRASAPQFGSSSISGEPIDFRQLKIPLGLLLAAPLAVGICGIIAPRSEASPDPSLARSSCYSG